MAPLLLLAACQGGAPGGGACTVQWHSTLPVTMRDGHAVVPARINGEPVGLIVDTGAEHTAVTPELVAALDLRPDPGMINSRVTGIGGNAYSQMVGLDSLTFAGVTYRKLDAAAASLGASGRGDMAASGLAGEDLLSRYDVGLDIGHREISFYTARGCDTVSPPWGTATPVPIRLSEHNNLVFPVELDGHRLTAMLDSGAGGDLLLDSGANALGLTPAMLAQDRAFTGTGVGERTITNHLHRFATLRVGGETIQAPLVAVSDGSVPGVDLILGMGFLRDRQVFVSHATARMFVRSNAGAARLAEGHE
ncbi:MAG: retroviral-like aspartic protease family protein [Janthinobacterium lividum]